mmetsp:Transcript_1827/g.5324  ORF Transcript_1827/g.5324 Transcript_1827/m.5324 type:complete len:210 (+) Transcript_1827:1201-1830(+)
MRNRRNRICYPLARYTHREARWMSIAMTRYLHRQRVLRALCLVAKECSPQNLWCTLLLMGSLPSHSQLAACPGPAAAAAWRRAVAPGLTATLTWRTWATSTPPPLLTLLPRMPPTKSVTAPQSGRRSLVVLPRELGGWTRIRATGGATRTEAVPSYASVTEFHADITYTPGAWPLVTTAPVESGHTVCVEQSRDLCSLCRGLSSLVSVV